MSAAAPLTWPRAANSSPSESGIRHPWQSVVVPSVLLLVCLAAFAATAEEAAEANATEDQEVAEEGGYIGTHPWLDTTHRTLSDGLEASVLAVDRFFATQQYLQDTTRSYVRLKLDLSADSDGEHDIDARLNAKLDLPGTKRRFTVLVTGESEEVDNQRVLAAEQQRETTLTLERNPRRETDEGWKIRPGAGVRDWPLQAFAQVRATNYRTLAGDWLTRTQARVRYLTDDRWDVSADLDFNRILNERWSFRASTNARWRDVTDVTNLNQYFSFFRRASDKVGVTHTLGLLADDTPSWRVATYLYSFGWRKIIYRDWMVFEARPELAFKRENDYDPTVGLLLRLEAWVGRYRR